MQAEFDSILTAAQAGADWAWRKIYDDLYATVVGYFRVQGATDAEALASDVLLQLAKSVSSFSGSYDQFRSWVFTIAHNRLIDDRRRKGRRVTEVAPHAAYTEPVGGDVETEAMAQISNSPDHSRDVWLVGVDGWFGLWCGVGWLIGVCRGSGGAGGLVRGA